MLTTADRDAIRAAFKAHIDQIADEAYAAPEPESTAERELADVYAPHNHDDHEGVHEGHEARRRTSDDPVAGAAACAPPSGARRF